MKVLIVRDQYVSNDGRVARDEEMLASHAQVGEVAVLLGQVREERQGIPSGPVDDRVEESRLWSRWKNSSRR
jgi:hypothetical protein